MANERSPEEQLNQTRAIYNRILASPNSMGGRAYALASTIESRLKKLGKSWRDLDATGNLSNEDIRTALAQKITALHINDAQRAYHELNNNNVMQDVINGKTAGSYLRDIQHHLSAANAPLSALDPRGEKTSEEMARNLDQRISTRLNHEEDALKSIEALKVTEVCQSGTRYNTADFLPDPALPESTLETMKRKNQHCV